jgi:hypothetical protein
MLVERITEVTNVLLQDLLKADRKCNKKEVQALIQKAVSQGQAKEGYNFLVG